MCDLVACPVPPDGRGPAFESSRSRFRHCHKGLGLSMDVPKAPPIPMADVMLVLLIIFLVRSLFSLQRLSAKSSYIHRLHLLTPTPDVYAKPVGLYRLRSPQIVVPTEACVL